jgi:hypothetical protein
LRCRFVQDEDVVRAIEMVERAGDCDQSSIDRPEVGDAFPRGRIDADAFKLAAGVRPGALAVLPNRSGKT